MIDGCRVRSRTNILLAHLSAEHAGVLAPHLNEAELVAGSRLLTPGDELDRVYFPLSAIVSVHERSGASDSIEVCLIGREGMIGWSALLGADRAAHGATVRAGGTALWMEVAHLRQACADRPQLFAGLLRFIHVLTVQMSRSAVSQRHDPVMRRVARLVLMRHDRIDGDELTVLHEEIGACLDVRRATVTDALHVLEGDHLIRCRRGRLQVRDRHGLELAAGDSYGLAEAHYRDMIGPFGKSGVQAGAVSDRTPPSFLSLPATAAP